MTMVISDTREAKKLFAAEILRNPGQGYRCALKITNGNSQAALQIVRAWTYDNEVDELKAELLEEYGEEYFLPTKAQMTRRVLERAESSHSDEDFGKLMKLAADMRGFIEKPGVTINNNNTITNKVMAIPTMVNSQGNTVDADGWESQALEQQQTLTDQ